MRILLALRRCRFGILTVGLAYLTGILTGMIMAHAGSGIALRYRDKIVGEASTSPILVALDKGNKWKAAVLDAAANSFAGSCSILGGYFIPAPYAIGLFRGWIGGIVGVDGHHRSRLRELREAFYYLLTLLLQVIPYSLTGGAGVHIGLGAFGLRSYPGKKWLTIPIEALKDAALLVCLSLPLFLGASLFEFLF